MKHRSGNVERTTTDLPDQVFITIRFMKINQLKAGAVLSYLILGLNNLVGLVYTPYMLRMMGQSEFGLY